MIKELKILDKQTLFDSDARYLIPRYQRAYAWQDDEIIQLIDDINGINNDENYYIGSLIVAKIKDQNNIYEVVDGQQRLTTLYILLHYLVSVGALEGTVERTLLFDCRKTSNHTLDNIQDILTNHCNIEDDEYEHSILNGINIIRQKFNNDNNLNLSDFVSKLEHVVLYRIEVPENTDLNRYFEIMNTRGEQLEQHDILKAQLMKHLQNRKEQEFFSRIWNACSDMTGYIQMHFSPKERQIIFGSEWNTFPMDQWNDYRDCFTLGDESENNATIQDIIQPGFCINSSDGILEDDIRVRFESIIDFPYFLLHSLRVFVKRYGITLKQSFNELFDDKKLIADFHNAIHSGTLNNKYFKDNPELFSKMFIIHLVQTRYLFDKFIIKREYSGDDQEGKWSLKELLSTGLYSKKTAYYINTKLNYLKEWEKTYDRRNKECLMIQAALRVSYTSPKIMHWITELLLWLFKHNEYPQLILVAENIASQAVKNNFLTADNYDLGVKTPHIVFNFLDYLIWKNNRIAYENFDFEFRNSVEHWYPQNPSDGSFDVWDKKDTFGNLCIISRSVNSKFSNLSPESKMKSYEKVVRTGSLKLRIMGEIIQQYSNDDWIKNKCNEHEETMVNILKDACGISN